MRRVGAFLLVAIMLCMTACSAMNYETVHLDEGAAQESADTPQQTQSELTIGVTEDIGRAHPLFPDSSQMASVTGMVFEGLFSLDETGRASFCLAQDYSVTINADGTATWVFNIRPNVMWHDGSGVVTADDAAFSIEAIQKSGGIYAENVLGIVTAAAADANTLHVLTDRYYADLPERLIFPIVPRAVYQGQNAGAPAMVGSGPYRVSAYNSDGYAFVLTAFESWWRQQPSIQTIRIVLYHDTAAVVEAFQQKQIHVALTNETTTGAGLGAGFGTVYAVRSRSLEVLIPNFSNGALADVRVRQAIAYAINKTDIMTLLYAKRAVDVDLPVWTGHYLDSPQIHPFDYDVRAARALLQEAGYIDTDGDGYVDYTGADGVQHPVTLTLVTNDTTENALRRQSANLIAESLAQIGIAVNVQVTDWATCVSCLSSGSYDLLLTGIMVPENPDPAFFCGSGHAGNYNGYYNQSVEDALAQANAAQTREEWETALQSAQQMMVYECATISLFYRCHALIADSRIVGIKPQGELRAFAGIENWTFYME